MTKWLAVQVTSDANRSATKQVAPAGVFETRQPSYFRLPGRDLSIKGVRTIIGATHRPETGPVNPPATGRATPPARGAATEPGTGPATDQDARAVPDGEIAS